MSTETALIDDTVAAVDVQRFAGDEPGGVVRHEGGSDAHVVDADEAARRRLGFRLGQQCIEFENARGGPRRERWIWREPTQVGCRPSGFGGARRLARFGANASNYDADLFGGGAPLI
jgi:hypothetical protein